MVVNHEIVKATTEPTQANGRLRGEHGTPLTGLQEAFSREAEAFGLPPKLSSPTSIR